MKRQMGEILLVEFEVLFNMSVTLEAIRLLPAAGALPGTSYYFTYYKLIRNDGIGINIGGCKVI